MPSIRRGKIAGENAVIWKEKKKNAVHNFAWNSILKLEAKGIILEGWGFREIRDIYLFFLSLLLNNIEEWVENSSFFKKNVNRESW